MGSNYCQACHKSNVLEYEDSVGFVCTSCGFVSEHSASSVLEVIGRVLETDEGAGSGRVYLHHDGVPSYAGGGGVARLGRDPVKGVYRTEQYQEIRQAASERYLRSVLTHFDLGFLFPRSKYIFDQVKQIGGFNWGKRAKTFAVASLYVASRERDKSLLISDLSAITEVELNTLTRAQKTIKSWLHIQTAELDPFVFLETHIVHFSALLASSPKPPLSGSKHPTWAPANLVWLRSLNLSDVRVIATGLASFLQMLKLASNRSPEQVSCALVAVAMEGVARRRAPNITEVQDEMAHLLGVARFTVAERYREIHKALADYIPQVPWITDLSGPKAKKAGLFQYIDDIVRFRSAMEVQRIQEVNLPNRRSPLSQSEALFKKTGQNEIPIDPNILLEMGDISNLDAALDDQDQIRDDERLAALLPDPLTDPRAAARLLDPTNFTLLLARSPIPHANVKREETGVQRRPAEYMRHRPTAAKKVYTIEGAASSLVSSLHPSFARDAALQSVLPASKVNNLNKTLPIQGSAPHDQRSVEFRKLLLAGHAPIEILSGKAQDVDNENFGRLKRLLMEKDVMDIQDDELFAEGELESMLRSQKEVELLSRSQRFVDIPDCRNGGKLEESEDEKAFTTEETRRVSLKASGNTLFGSSATIPEPMVDQRLKVNHATNHRLERLFNRELEEFGNETHAMDTREEMQMGMALSAALEDGHENDDDD